MRIQCAKLANYNTRAVDLLKRWQEHRVPCGDVDAIAGPQPDSMAAPLGHKAEAIPLGLEDPPFIVEGFLDECREHRLISGIHVFSFARVCGFQRSQQGLAAGSAATFQSCATPQALARAISEALARVDAKYAIADRFDDAKASTLA
jgi:hypothetical protein